MRLIFGFLSILFCFILPCHSIFFTKNSSKKVVESIHRKGWWEPQKANAQFTLTPTEFQKLKWEDEHEFVLFGKYYDVLEKIDSCGYFILKVYKDQQDTRWSVIQKISKHTEKNTKSNPSNYILWICQIGIPFKLSNLFFYPSISISFHSNHFINFSIKPHSPPPKA